MSAGSRIRISVQPANPGQYFACCGLFELADRLYDGAEAWFERNAFCVRTIAGEKTASLPELLDAIASAPLNQLDADDNTASPIEIPFPFRLRLDWWKDVRTGGSQLKAWAGTMRGVRIARAMQSVLGRAEFRSGALLDCGAVVYDPLEQDKKVEPFYFDARRGSTAHPVDVGFSPDSLAMTSIAHPAVEFLCLVGLQRFRPFPVETRVFRYYTWTLPLPVIVAPLAACGLLPQEISQGFRFENAFRTDQKKHKGFTSSTRILENPRKEHE